jgi:2-polyprenyl-3-methyl-5-hydroxy-6-metoxy-1,4-benzoquinol methylase
VRDSSVDVVISTQVIEHVDDDAKMAREMYRIASPNATVYVATIFKKWYGWYFYRCNGKWTIDPTHLREYSKDSQLLDTLTDAGLEIVASKKTLDGRSLLDAGLKRVRASRSVYDNKFLKRLRSFRIPIPGYYIWEVVCKKEPS